MDSRFRNPVFRESSAVTSVSGPSSGTRRTGSEELDVRRCVVLLGPFNFLLREDEGGGSCRSFLCFRRVPSRSAVGVPGRSWVPGHL